MDLKKCFYTNVLGISVIAVIFIAPSLASLIEK